MPETISLWICNFVLLDDTLNYKDQWAIYSKNRLNNKNFTPVFAKNRYIIIELPKFKKTASEVTSAEETWVYLLSHLGEKQPVLPPSAKSETVLTRALDRIRVCDANKELIKKQETYMVDEDEINARMYDSYNEGHSAGIAEGRSAGIAEGVLMKSKEMAKSLLNQGVPISVIEKASGLSRKELESL